MKKTERLAEMYRRTCGYCGFVWFTAGDRRANRTCGRCGEVQR